MKKGKILFLIDKVESGGAENVLLKIINGFEIDGYEVFLLPNLTVKEEFLYKLKNEINYIDPKISINSNIFSKVYSLFLYILKIFDFVKKNNPIVVVSFLERSNISNVFVSYFTKHKSIISTRNNLSKQYKDRNFYEKKIIKYFIKTTYNRASLLITLSNSVKLDLVNNYFINKNKIKTIYNPYDLKHIRKLALEPLESKFQTLFKQENVCITVGRLSEQKGHINLINSFKYVIEEIPNAKLIILGEGELFSILEEKIFELNLNSNIFLIGHHKNPYKYIYNSKLFVFSSLWEGFGNALLEAMVCGKPVISTDCHSGPREILSKANLNIKLNEKIEFSDYGLLTPVFKSNISPKEEKIFASSIILFFKDKRLCEKYKIQSKTRSDFFESSKILAIWKDTILNNE